LVACIVSSTRAFFSFISVSVERAERGCDRAVDALSGGPPLSMNC